MVLEFASGFSEIWSAIVFCMAWFGMYEILIADFNYNPEAACRIVTVLHGCSVTLLSALAWYLGPDPFEEHAENTFSQKVALSVSLGYFIFDLAWCLWYQTEGNTMIAHHIISLVVLSRVLMRNKGGAEAVAGLMCMEITNPFLQARWFVLEAGLRDTIYHTVIELTFILLFIFFRLVVGTLLCFAIIKAPTTDLETKLSAVALYCVSLVFLASMIRYFFFKYIMGTPAQRGSIIPTKTTRGTANDNSSISTANTSTEFGPSTSGMNSTTASSSVHNTSTFKDKNQ